MLMDMSSTPFRSTDMDPTGLGPASLAVPQFVLRPAFDPIPADPGALLAQWLENARRHSGQPNWNVMALATVGADGRPSVRPVLHKFYDPATARLTFFTNYESRKGREIDANANVALSLHWDALERVVRVEGRAERVPAGVSDAYFASRPRESQIGAWASAQSEPFDDWATLVKRVKEATARFGDGSIPRPPDWGGYAVAPERIEFWLGRLGRIHERLLYERDTTSPTDWRVARLFP